MSVNVYKFGWHMIWCYPVWYIIQRFNDHSRVTHICCFAVYCCHIGSVFHHFICLIKMPPGEMHCSHGFLVRYVKLRVAHAPGMPRTFSPPPRVSNPDMHHGTCVTHVPWCVPGSLISGFFWSRWRGKRSRRMRNPQFYVSGQRPIEPRSTPSERDP